jgi:hypothetical protein
MPAWFVETIVNQSSSFLIENSLSSMPPSENTGNLAPWFKYIILLLVLLLGSALCLLSPTDFKPPAEVKVNMEFSVSSETNFSDSNATGAMESASTGKVVFVAGVICFVAGLTDGSLTELVLLSGL